MYTFVDAPGQAYDVIIIGGGFAGASAARELTRHGKRVLIVEARDRLAGRTWFESDYFGEGLPIEWGGAFMLDRKTFPTVWAEIDAHQLPLAWGSEEETDLVWRTDGVLRTGPLPVPLESLGDFERSVALLDSSARRISTETPLSAQNLAGLDVSYREFFEGHDFDAHTLDVWRAQAITVAGDDWEVPSILPLLVSIAHSGSFAASFFVESPIKTPVAATLGPQLAKGTISLYEAVLGDSEAEVLLNTRVEWVRRDGGLVRVGTSAGELSAPAVVAAVGLNVLHRIEFDDALSEAHRRLSERGVAGQAEKISVLVSGCLRPFYGHGMPEGAGFSAISSTWHQGDRAILVGFTTWPGALDPNDRGQVERAIQEFVPGVTVERTAGHDWAGDELSGGTWSYYRPGQMALALEVSNKEGNIAFASSDYHRSMGIEGALQSGRAAAAQLLNALHAG